jgi:hypothetical protein
MKHRSAAIPGLFILLIAVAVMSACARPIPELKTSAERIAATEILYQELLSTASDWAEQGRLSDQLKEKLTMAFDRLELSLAIAKGVLRSDDPEGAGIAASNLNTALLAIQAILLESSQ